MAGLPLCDPNWCRPPDDGDLRGELAVGFGAGSELRQPLGIAIVGDPVVSQVLTLYTTPVLYLVLDRFRPWARGRWERTFPRLAGSAGGGGVG